MAVLGLRLALAGGVRLASELSARHRSAAYGAPWSSWRIANPHGVLVYGPPGSGKSTLVYSMAVSAARQQPVLIVAAEEGHEATTRDRLDRCGLNDLAAQRISVADARSLPELTEDIARVGKNCLIVVDSLSEMRLQAETLAQYADGRSWIATQHVTTAGIPRGGWGASHKADVVIRVVKCVVTPSKNRWGAHAAINIWEPGESDEGKTHLAGLSESQLERQTGQEGKTIRSLRNVRPGGVRVEPTEAVQRSQHGDATGAT